MLGLSHHWDLWLAQSGQWTSLNIAKCCQWGLTGANLHHQGWGLRLDLASTPLSKTVEVSLFSCLFMTITEWLRLEGTSGDSLVQPLCWSTVSYHGLPQDGAQLTLEYTCRWGPHNLCGQPVQVFDHLVQKVFSSVLMELHVLPPVPIISCSVSGYHWQESGSFFFIPSYQLFICTDKILLPDGPKSGTRLSASMWRVGKCVLCSMLMWSKPQGSFMYTLLSSLCWNTDSASLQGKSFESFLRGHSQLEACLAGIKRCQDFRQDGNWLLSTCILSTCPWYIHGVLLQWSKS